MSIRLAEKSDFDIVKEITHTTINEIYPHYYPNGAVNFFLNHHNADNIKNDISENCVFLFYDSNKLQLELSRLKIMRYAAYLCCQTIKAMDTAKNY